MKPIFTLDMNELSVKKHYESSVNKKNKQRYKDAIDPRDRYGYFKLLEFESQVLYLAVDFYNLRK